MTIVKAKLMFHFLRDLRLRVKVSLLGVGGVVVTAVALVALAVAQSGQYHRLAQREADALRGADLDHITRGIYNLVQTEDEAVQQQVNFNLNVARRVLANLGDVSLANESVTWAAVNQLDNATTQVQLPRMMVGGQWLGSNSDPGVKTLVVDEVMALVGESATVFQRMNARGDMLRVATTVRTRDGKRAIGTYIPAIDPDGAANPVVTTILRGERYHGRAFVVNAWHLTAYEPIKDVEGKLVGMLNVGVQQKTVEARIRHAVLQTRVGTSGYVYVLSGRGEDRGRYIISQNAKRDGENIWESQDSDGDYVVQTVIAKATAVHPGELATVHYRWQNPGEHQPRWKTARLAYYPPWDWVIGVSTYDDELQRDQAVLAGGRGRMISIMALAGLAITLSVGLASAFVARTIARPVDEMTRVARRVIQGDWGQAVEVDSHDEVGVLAKTFNFMTDRLKETMAGLRRSEERHRLIFENAIEGIFLTSFEGRMLSANPAFARMLAYDSADELVAALTDLRCQLYVRPEDRDALLAEIRERDIVLGLELQFLRKDRQPIWVSFSARAVCDDAGRPLFIQGFATDVTERRRAEVAVADGRRFSDATIDSIPGVFYVYDEQGDFLRWNANLETVTGYSSEEIRAMKALDLVPEEDLGVTAAAIRKVFESGYATIVIRLLTRDGRKIPFLLSGLATTIEGKRVLVGTGIDIAEQMKAEEARRASETRYRSLFDGVPAGLFRSTPTGEILDANAAMVEILGYPDRESLLAAGAAPLYVTAGDRDRWRCEVEREGIVRGFEVRMRRHDGTIIDVRHSSRAVRDADGRIVCYEGSLEDVTDLKQAEEERDRLFNCSIDMLSVGGSGGRLKQVNPAWERTLGWSKEELCSKPWIEFVHRDDRARTAEADQQLAEGRLGCGFENRWRCKDGSYRWLSWHTSPLSAKGEVFSVTRDVTEQKRAEDALRESEQRFRMLVQTAPCVILCMSTEGEITEFNPEAERLYGRRRDDVVGLDYVRLCVADDEREAVVADIAKVIAGQPTTGFENRVVTADGTEHVLIWNINQRLDAAGNVLGIVCAGQDITERKQAERERAAHVRFLEHMEQIDQAIRKATDLDEMMTDVLDAVLSILQCDRAWLLRPCDPDAPSWGVPMIRTRPEYSVGSDSLADIPAQPDLAEVFRTLLGAPGPVAFGPGSAQPLPPENARRFGYQSVMAKAVHPKVGPPWVLGLHQCSHPRVWTQEEAAILHEIGRRVADGLTSLLSLQELRASEERLKLALDVQGAGIWEMDFRTGRHIVDPRICEYLGFAPGEEPKTAQEWQSLWHPEDAPRIPAAVEAHARGETPVCEFEARVRHRDGRYGWAHARGRVVERDGDGRPCRMIGTSADITDRKQAEMELLREKQFSEKLLESLPGIFFLYDSTCHLKRWNKAHETAMGFTADELRDWYIPDWHETPEDAAVGMALVKRVLETGVVASFETTLVNKQGCFVPYLISITRLMAPDGPFMMGVGVDITERKQAEEELQRTSHESQLMLSNMINAFVVWESVLDESGRFVSFRFAYFNEAYSRIAKIRLDDVRGKDVFEVWPDTEQSWVDVYGEVALSGVPKTFDMYHGPTKGLYHCNAYRLWDSPDRVCVIFEDITERKLREERVRGLNAIREDLLKPAPLAAKLQMITDAAVAVFQADFARIWIVGRGDLCEAGCLHARETGGLHACPNRRQCLHLTASSGRYTHLDGEKHRRVPLGSYKIGRVAAGEDAKFVTNDAARDPRIHDHAWAAQLGLVGFAGYKLASPDGTPVGVLALFSQNAFSPDDDALLETLANTVSQVILTSNAEEALRESEERYRALFQNSPEALFVLDEAGRFLDANDVAVGRYGYSRKELLTMSARDLAASAVQDEAPERVHQSLQTGAQFEWRYRRKDGSELPVEISVRPITLGGTRCVFSSVRDITDRKRAEEERDRLFNGSIDMLCVAGFDGRFKQLNPAWERTLGWSKEELRSRPYLDFVHPDDRQATIGAGRQLAEGQAAYGFENRYRCKDGSYRWMSWNSFPLPAQSEIFAVVRDVTERKRYEAELIETRALVQAVVAQSPVPMVVARPDGTLMIFNEACREILGLQDELGLQPGINLFALNQTWRDYDIEGHLLSVHELPLALALRGQSTIGKELRIVRKDGTERWEIVHGTPVYGADGALIAGFIIFPDITERKRAEAERERLVKELETKNQELESLLYAASHDMRSPLVNIQGFALDLDELCQSLTAFLSHPGEPATREGLDPRAIEERISTALHFIRTSGDKMNALINGMLKVSRTGRATLHLESLDMNRLLENVVASLSYQIHTAAAAVTIDPLPRCLGDADHINQVFTNLLDNALKYRDPSRPLQVRVTGHVQDRLAVYCVEDTGVGIASGHQPQIWELFHRLDPQGVAGEGVGLSLVRRIVARHNGRVWLESEAGRGSRFFVALPVAE